MQEIIYVGTIQVAVRGCEDQAIDAIAGLFENADPDVVIDWAYLKLGGQYMFPTKRLVTIPYTEGDFLK